MRSKDVTLTPPMLHPAMPRWIRADRSRISQIVGNLLSNSAKFTAEGRIGILVDMEVDSKQDNFLISVQVLSCKKISGSLFIFKINCIFKFYIYNFNSSGFWVRDSNQRTK